MTPEAQRIAIAEACGYKWFRWGAPKDSWHFLVMPREDNGSFVESARPSGEVLFHARIEVPDYLTDLNAMHEAENTMWPGVPWEAYGHNLVDVVGDTNPARATAAQRAEAFLRTIGKWEDGK